MANRHDPHEATLSRLRRGPGPRKNAHVPLANVAESCDFFGTNLAAGISGLHFCGCVVNHTSSRHPDATGPTERWNAVRFTSNRDGSLPAARLFAVGCVLGSRCRSCNMEPPGRIRRLVQYRSDYGLHLATIEGTIEDVFLRRKRLGSCLPFLQRVAATRNSADSQVLSPATLPNGTESLENLSQFSEKSALTRFWIIRILPAS